MGLRARRGFSGCIAYVMRDAACDSAALVLDLIVSTYRIYLFIYLYSLYLSFSSTLHTIFVSVPIIQIQEVPTDEECCYRWALNRVNITLCHTQKLVLLHNKYTPLNETPSFNPIQAEMIC